MTIWNHAIAATLPFVPKGLVHRIAQKYIAGETVGDAIATAARLNAKGFRATMDILGEDIHTLEQARQAAAAYMELLDRIRKDRIDSNVSIKLTQLGLKIDKRVCRDLAAAVVSRAQELENFVRIDMENSSCTSDTLEIHRALRADFTNVGVVVQAYLRRTINDVIAMDDLRPNLRLCKGVYVEPRQVAYTDMDIINRNYVHLLERLLRRGFYVGIATHDERMVWEAMRLIRELNLAPTAYEFQMLLGVDEELRDLILAAGHPLRVYIPFGKDWYAYSIRRLRENPRLAGYVLAAALRSV
jgi:proline dehydrogenase